MSVAHEKKLAAEAAAQLVEDGMIVGLGTGSTVAYLLPALAVRGLDLRCVATSPATEHLARDLGIKVEPFRGRWRSHGSTSRSTARTRSHRRAGW
jgi:ribose 5-phosphate isomerase A